MKCKADYYSMAILDQKLLIVSEKV